MQKFNLRVYGLVLNEHQEILLSDEVYKGLAMTKFPGGGLEWGEGIKDALKREFREELNWEIEVGELFYLTDFFQLSAFNPKDQLISVYYWVQSHNNTLPQTKADSRESHRWVALSQLEAKDLSFPIDKIVAKKLRELF